MSIRTHAAKARLFARCLLLIWSQMTPRGRARLVAVTLVRAGAYLAWIGFAYTVIAFCAWLFMTLWR